MPVFRPGQIGVVLPTAIRIKPEPKRENLFERLLDAAVLVSVAAMAALAAGSIGHYFFGLSRIEIRQDALALASVLTGLVGYCSGRQKQK